MESYDGAPSKNFEIKCGITIAVFAAVLAISDLYSGKFGDDEIKAVNEKASSFMWYQSKSIKETVLEGQQGLLQAMIGAGAISGGHVDAIQKHIRSLREEIGRYSLEKKEILLGSAAVGPANWAQEINGEKGQVKGAQEWSQTVEQLGHLGDRLDLASLFLQLGLVLGAVSLVLQNRRSQWLFYGLMILMGIVGTGITVSTLMT